MSLNDSKIHSLKPASRPVKVSDSHVLYLLINQGGSRTCISNIASVEKNPESVSPHIRWYHLHKPDNSAMVSVSCWHRILTRRSSEWQKKRPVH